MLVTSPMKRRSIIRRLLFICSCRSEAVQVLFSGYSLFSCRSTLSIRCSWFLVLKLEFYVKLSWNLLEPFGASWNLLEPFRASWKVAHCAIRLKPLPCGTWWALCWRGVSVCWFLKSMPRGAGHCSRWRGEKLIGGKSKGEVNWEQNSDCMTSEEHSGIHY